ncbi:MAG: helix-turn-helix transcriptional regulator [Cyclobacteriaceae bacterium]|nr:helix-turn-helix transcriptional regulator [Cyclobacteriaceae bacterium]
MEKKLLTEVRIKKGFTQQQMADLLHMDVSSYNRKEKGTVKIRPEEWERMARALNVPAEEIFEADDAHSFIFKDSSTGNYLGTNQYL